jgi:fermentation-respiration switch protein FrsA (DUF1100 family)
MSHHFSDRWFYRPSQEQYGHPDEHGLKFESVRFTSGPHKLHGWFFPADGEAMGTVVHCHGNAGNITGHFEYVAWMPPWGWSVLCFDYRGFGESEGRPSRTGTIEDVAAAIDYVSTREEVNSKSLLLLGQSLGGAVGIVAAAGRDDLAGIAIEGAFSAYQAAAKYVCWRSIFLWPAIPFIGLGLVPQGLDPIDHIARIAPTPILFIAGTADRICDPGQTVALHAAAGEPKSLWVIESGSHVSALAEDGEEGRKRLDGFFRDCVRNREATKPDS